MHPIPNKKPSLGQYSGCFLLVGVLYCGGEEMPSFVYHGPTSGLECGVKSMAVSICNPATMYAKTPPFCYVDTTTHNYVPCIFMADKS